MKRNDLYGIYFIVFHKLGCVFTGVHGIWIINEAELSIIRNILDMTTQFCTINMLVLAGQRLAHGNLISLL